MFQMVYFPEFAIWDDELEKMLIEYRQHFRKVYTAINDNKEYEKMVNEKEPMFWIKKYRDYELLRFAKVAYCLRKRQPDDMIGNSILVFHLSDNDLKQILGNELEK